MFSTLELIGSELIFAGEKLADISPSTETFLIKKFEYWLEEVTAKEFLSICEEENNDNE